MENLSIYSAVKESLKGKLLLKGTLLGLLGSCLLFYAGIFLPVSQLTFWGLPIFFVGGGLIAWALIPYRKLTTLENKPLRLVADQDHNLYYLIKGKQTIKIPQTAIEAISYQDDNNDYGIGIKLKSDLTDKVVIYDNLFNINSFQKRSRHEHAVDLFFPYFNLKSYQSLMKYLQMKPLEND